ncbi:MAG: hypothetical protein NZ602_07640 [Thermoguttaceae bacterium]|nr:hypothetical protein [Thermoguttaceae bacterium]MDW8038281.1 hypothetical protein [Thermoguttaceae bacterium]
MAGVFLGIFGGLVLADQPSRSLLVTSGPSKPYALLVAVESESNPEGAFRTNDVHGLAEQLLQAGYPAEHLLLMTCRADKPQSHPLRKNLEKQIPEFFAQIKPEDGLLIYWTGQVYRSPKGELWLATADWEPAQPAETSLSVAWLKKQLETCRAKWKLMIIDTPFQPDKTAGFPRVGSQQLAEALEDAPGLALLTSSRAEQSSPVWPLVEQSNFGFWLCQAVAGHADRDENNQISLQELVDYLFAKVTKTAREIYQQEQTLKFYQPVAYFCPVVATISKASLSSVLEKFAEQIGEQAAQHGVVQIAVAEFRPLSEQPCLGSLLDGGPGCLGRWCAENLEKALHQKASLMGFRVFPYEEFHTALIRNKWTPQLLPTSQTRSLTVQARTPEAVIVGSFSARSGRRLTLQCKLTHLSTGRTLCRSQRTVLLTNEELGMLGVSLDGAWAWLPPKAPSPQYPLPPSSPPSEPKPVPSPPQFEPGFPFRLMIYVDGRPRASQPIGQKEYVLFRRGEVYQIVVENHLPEPVYLRLLVDGLNTLPEPVLNSSGMLQKGQLVYLPARRVHLEKARAWLLDGCSSEGTPKRYCIQGFYRRMESTTPGKALYEWESFKVVDPPQSWAAQQRYTEQIGIITAAFYALPVGPRGGLQPAATGPGPTQKGELQEYLESPVGPLLSLIHLYYALQPEDQPLPAPPSSLSGNNP